MGEAPFHEPRLIQLALADGMAKTCIGKILAPRRGEKALESLGGTFSLCILDESAREAWLSTTWA